MERGIARDQNEVVAEGCHHIESGGKTNIAPRTLEKTMTVKRSRLERLHPFTQDANVPFITETRFR